MTSRLILSEQAYFSDFADSDTNHDFTKSFSSNGLANVRFWPKADTRRYRPSESFTAFDQMQLFDSF